MYIIKSCLIFLICSGPPSAYLDNDLQLEFSYVPLIIYLFYFEVKFNHCGLVQKYKLFSMWHLGKRIYLIMTLLITILPASSALHTTFFLLSFYGRAIKSSNVSNVTLPLSSEVHVHTGLSLSSTCCNTQVHTIIAIASGLGVFLWDTNHIIYILSISY